jgi:hypothetical protein
MQHVGRHPAEARDGPLARDTDLTVAKQEGQHLWPTPVVWSAAGVRHVYELMAVKVGSNRRLWPVYAFRRSLDAGESEPAIAWTVPPRYVM